MKVLICCDNARRDLLPSKLLVNKLKKSGHTVVLCNGRTLRILFRFFKPEITILSRADYPIAKEIGKLTKLIIVPSEGARLTKETMLSVFIGRTHKFDKNNQRLDHNDQVIKDFNHIYKLFLWGRQTYNFLIESGFFKSDQLEISGNPRLDVYNKDKHIKKSKTNNIGIAITVKSLSSYYGKTNYLELFSNLVKFDSTNSLPLVPKNRNWEDYAWRDFAIARIAMKTIDEIFQKSNFNIKIRVNPFENYKDYLFLKKKYGNRIIIDPPDYQLNEFLNEIDLLVTCWSTTGVESLINYIPVISIVNLLDQKHLMSHIDPKANGFESHLPLYYRPNSYSELLRLLNMDKENKLNFCPEPKLFKKYVSDIYNWPSSTNASDYIVEKINQTRHKIVQKSELGDILLFNSKIENLIQMNYLFEKSILFSIFSIKTLINYFDDYVKNFSNHYRYFYKLRNRRIDSIISDL